MSDKRTEAMVSIVLNISENPDAIVGKPVSDEELVAYIEGGLDEVRQAQISSYIANDKQVYSRWLLLVENAEDIELIAATSTSEPTQTKLSLLEILKNTLDELTVKWLVPSGALSVLAFAAIGFYLYQPSHDLDILYSDFGSISHTRQVPLPTRSFDPFNSDWVSNNESIAIMFGVDQGLLDLDVISQVDKTESTESSKTTLGEKHWRLYNDLGRWAILSHYQCLQKTPDYFDRALPVLDIYINDLIKVNTDYSLKLEKKLSKNKQVLLNDSEDKFEPICASAFAIIEIATGSPISSLK